MYCVLSEDKKCGFKRLDRKCSNSADYCPYKKENEYDLNNEMLNKHSCGSKPEMFINYSYYHMITIRCTKCEIEKDYHTVKDAIYLWNEEFK